MIIQDIRKWHTNYSTIGEWVIDGQFFCYVLEDKDRQIQPDGSIITWHSGLKVPKETAIPYGHYEVITNYSNRFKRVMPLILNVPDFQGVRIHNGNTGKDTEGCPLLGFTKAPDFVGQSVQAFGKFMTILTAGLKNGRVSLEIINGGVK